LEPSHAISREFVCNSLVIHPTIDDSVRENPPDTTWILYTATMQDSNNNKSVCTAVCVEKQDLEEPLLLVESSSQEETNNDTITTSNLNAAFRRHGCVIGFLAQIINVSGTTYLHYRWGTSHSEELEWQEWLLRTCIWITSQVDLYVYVLMWLGLTAILTQKGMEYVQSNWCNRPKRDIFILGVQFYVGVVLGVFFAWAAVDIGLGLFIPLLPMVGVVVFGLAISHTMVWCYDLEEDDVEEEVGMCVIME
jgi:hypothetical protein